MSPLSKSFLFSFDGSCELVVTLVTFVFIAVFLSYVTAERDAFEKKKESRNTHKENPSLLTRVLT